MNSFEQPKPTNPTVEDTENQFEIAKREYFTKLGLSVRKALELHKEEGLWERDEAGNSWRNVTEHCLVEVARAEVLADLLRLSEEAKQNVRIAAALHDFYKRREIESLDGSQPAWDSFDQSNLESYQKLEQAGFSPEIVAIASAIGHGSIPDIELLLEQNELSETNIGQLILHYVDDYTMGSNWTEPAELNNQSPVLNDLDRRITKNASNPKYQELNEAGRAHFDGETTFKAQLRIGRLVEQKIAELILKRTAQPVHPKLLPELVDSHIKQAILQDTSQSSAQQPA